MKITVDEVIAWLIVGALAGSLAGMLAKRRKEGFGRVLNLALGLIGAVVGGFLFKILHIQLGLLGAVTITSEEIVAGVCGSLLFLVVIWGIRKAVAWRNKAAESRPMPRSDK